ncbi:MAG: glycosyltransferase family 87 protein [Gemmataceae bacterium]
MHGPHSISALSKWERRGLIVFGFLIVGFGVLTEVRSVYLKRRMGDLGCYLRAAWAVRADADLYAVCDDNGWHYNYPPLLAILATPLADAPLGASRTGLAPYGVSVGIWYAGCVLCLFLAVQVLATALEKASPDAEVRFQPAGCRRWWALRVLPVLACLPPIGSDLVRGQANLLLLAALCGLMAGLIRGQPWRAGFCLAGAICLKVFPAFLLVYPLWRRDYRCLAGCALGLLLGLALIPAAVFGPVRAWDSYRTFVRVTLAPGLGEHADESRSAELTGVTSTDTQAFLAVIHNTTFPNRESRPMWVAPWVRACHWILGGVLTGITLLMAGRRKSAASPETVLTLGSLVLLMILLSPVCHMHYFLLALPVIMGLISVYWDRHGFSRLGAGLSLLLAVNLIGNILPRLPGLEILRDFGMVTYATLLVWFGAVFAIRKTKKAVPIPLQAGDCQQPQMAA